jgi:hypothetical protein
VTFRPQLESLDTRIVPATLRWTDQIGDNNATEAPNWQVQVGNNWVPAAQPPQTGDDVIFDGSVFGVSAPPPPGGGAGGLPGTGGLGGLPSTEDCNGLHVLSGQNLFNSIQLINGYTGTVTVGDDASGGLSTNILNLTSGAIAQPDQGLTDLTVLSNLNWTGGNLNQNGPLANLTITVSSATALFAPSNAGTVSCGDNINIDTGASAEFDPGTFNFTNAPQVNVTNNAQANFVTFANPDKIKFSGVTQVNIGFANLGVIGPGTWDSGASMYNKSGIVRITGGATVQLQGTILTRNNNILQSSYFQGVGADMQLRSGSNLEVALPATIGGGTFRTLFENTLADNVSAQTATVTGNLMVLGGTVAICDPTGQITTKHYGTLYVTGWVDMEAGTYTPGIDSTTSGNNDHWESGGTFSVNQGQNGAPGTASLAPIASGGANTISNGIWNIIKSRTAQYAGTFVNNSLQYSAGPPAKSFHFGTSGTPVNLANLDTVGN